VAPTGIIFAFPSLRRFPGLFLTLLPRKCSSSRYLLILFLGLSFSPKPSAENLPDTLKDSPKKEKIKKGWNFGALPVLGYDSDLGFQYGALANIYYYGDGSTYPQYFHSFYFEISRYTKGSGINQFFFDSKKLIPHMRVTTDVTYLTEKALNFYGFNGYEAVYNPGWENDLDTSSYKSRVFYRYERQFLRIGLDLQGTFFNDHLFWLGGFTFLKINTGPVDVEALNRGKKESKQLPYVPGLYDEYVLWGVLSAEEKKGGMNNFIKLGLVYDTRDNEPNPMRGIWSEVIFLLAPAFIGDGHYSFAKVSVIHRQYFTLVKNDLSLVYRVGYQGTIAGKVPFYFQPYMFSSYSQSTIVDGLGGGRSLRGILRNRVVGDGAVYANAELRWKFLRFQLFKQNFYLALNAFGDAGMVVQEVKVDESGIPPGVDASQYFSTTAEYPHVSAGGGFRIAMNQNFIISCDYGHVIDKRDGSDGVYVSLGYLF
jgi:outer membrane protein assembly factor BamA